MLTLPWLIHHLKHFRERTREVGKGTVDHHAPISLEDLKKLYKHFCVFTTDTPFGLVNKVIFEIILYFCRRGQESLANLKVTNFAIKTSVDGVKYVHKITSELDKNHQGNTSTNDPEGTGGKMYATGNDICCVLSFEKYLTKRHQETDRLFLHPKDMFIDSDTVWYRKEPMGVDTLSTFMKRMSTMAELSPVYSNHCIRAITISLLNHGGFESRHVVTVSGHRNEASLASYCYDTSGKISSIFPKLVF